MGQFWDSVDGIDHRDHGWTHVRRPFRRNGLAATGCTANHGRLDLWIHLSRTVRYLRDHRNYGRRRYATQPVPALGDDPGTKNRTESSHGPGQGREVLQLGTGLPDLCQLLHQHGRRFDRRRQRVSAGQRRRGEHSGVDEHLLLFQESRECRLYLVGHRFACCGSVVLQILYAWWLFLNLFSEYKEEDPNNPIE